MKNSTALLIIDMQEGFITKETQYVDTDACVLANATYLFDNGFDITVYSKLCASTGGIDIHDVAIEIIEKNIGTKNIV